MGAKDICPVCGRGDGEVFMAGDGETGSRAVSHIACVERLWQLPHVCHRAEQAKAELAAYKTGFDGDVRAQTMRAKAAEAALAKLTQRNDELRSTLKAYLATIKRLEAKVADREASKAEAEARYSDVVAEHENELAQRDSRRCQECDHFGLCETNRAAWRQFEVQPFSCVCWTARAEEGGGDET